MIKFNKLPPPPLIKFLHPCSKADQAELKSVTTGIFEQDNSWQVLRSQAREVVLPNKSGEILGVVGEG